ncbi:MAG: trypsin-like peptidase domain-containing protein [Thermoleophilia bacterium]|nr:trypsin-like peptidase domain-containing protein [Thermoleophilia bacterium]
MTDTSEHIRSAARSGGPAVFGLGRWGRGSGVVVADGLALAAPHHHPRGGPHHHHPHRGAPFRHRGPQPPWRGDRNPVAVFGDGRTVDAESAGTDPRTGLVVLRLDTTGVTPIPPAAADPRLGDLVLALGNPGGRGLRVTPGFVASEPRILEGPGGRTGPMGIEHSAPLTRGAAGGPLLDPDGGLLGINVMRPGWGLTLAVATGADVAQRAAAVAGGTVARPRTLGVALAPGHVAQRLRRAVGLPEAEGVLVRAVDDGSPAAAAGLGDGDLITQAGGAPVTEMADLARAIDAAPADGRLTLTVLRGTETREVEVVLAEEPVA